MNIHVHSFHISCILYNIYEKNINVILINLNCMKLFSAVISTSKPFKAKSNDMINKKIIFGCRALDNKLIII
jgi:hypothetical protein